MGLESLEKLRIGWFSPVEGSKPLFSSYLTHKVLPELSKEADITLFVDSYDFNILKDKKGGILNYCQVSHYLRANAIHKENPFDCFVHQLEDDERVSPSYDFLSMFPGLVVLHDVNFFNLSLDRMSPSSHGIELRRLMEKRYGEQAGVLGDFEAREWSISAFKRMYPIYCNQLGKSKALITFGELNDDNWQRNLESVEVGQSTFPCDQNVAVSSVEAKLSLGLDKESRIIVVCGDDFVGNRIGTCLEVFDRLFRDPVTNDFLVDQDVRVVWLVSSADQYFKANENLVSHVASQELMDISQLVEICSPNSKKDFVSYIQASDICIALSNVAGGGLPLAAYQAISNGVPTLVTDSVATEHLPKNSVLKISMGRGEREMIYHTLKELMINHEFAELVSFNALAYSKEVATTKSFVSDLLQVVREKCVNGNNSVLLDKAVKKETIKGLSDFYEERSISDSDGKKILDLNSALADEANSSFDWDGVV